MIRCNMCGDVGEADEMYFVSLLPLFTYHDAVLCKTCVLQLQGLIEAGKTIEFEWEDEDKPECGFYWSGYDERLDFITQLHTLDAITHLSTLDEIICPDCGGMSIWTLEDLGEDEDGKSVFGDQIWFCLNCAWWGYVL